MDLCNKMDVQMKTRIAGEGRYQKGSERWVDMLTPVLWGFGEQERLRHHMFATHLNRGQICYAPRKTYSNVPVLPGRAT